MYVSDYIDIFYKPIYYLLISYNIECDQNDCDVKLTTFIPARRYASAGYSDRNVSVCLSVCLSVCPSRAGIVSKRRKLAS